MQIDTGTLAIVLAALSFCGALGCIVALTRTRRELVEQQEGVSAQLSQLNQKLEELTIAAEAQAEPGISEQDLTDVQDDLLAAVTAAAAAIADRKTRIRSVTQVSTEPEASNAWSQQGRVVVQSSHNIGPRR